jgi:hypothetical protein
LRRHPGEFFRITRCGGFQQFELYPKAIEDIQGGIESCTPPRACGWIEDYA